MRAFWGCGERRRVGLCGCARFRGGSDGLLGVSGRVWSVWGRVEPVGEVPVGLFAGVWAGLAELWEGAEAGEGGEVGVGPGPSGG